MHDALLWLPSDGAYFLYFALGVIIVGNGLFKPNSGNMVRKIYEGDDTRIDSAFTIYYMAVNIGSMISMTLTPWIRDTVGALYGDSAGWHTAFGVCSIGLMIGLTNYALRRLTLAHIGSTPAVSTACTRSTMPRMAFSSGPRAAPWASSTSMRARRAMRRISAGESIEKACGGELNMLRIRAIILHRHRRGPHARS